VAACPECGLRSDLGALATQRWDRPWYQAPRFNTVALPAVWVFVSLIGGVLYAMAISGVAGTPGVLLTLLYPVLAIASWAALLGLAWARCGQWAGVGYALLAHWALATYIGGILTVALAFISATSFFTAGPALNFPIALLMVVVGVGFVLTGRKAEKAVAAHCIRLHLKRRVTS